MSEVRLPTRDAVEAFVTKYPNLGEKVDNLVQVYNAALHRFDPLQWPERMDYDRPVRSAQVVVNFISEPSGVFAAARLICWTMVTIVAYRTTQRTAIAILSAVSKCPEVFPHKASELEREVANGLTAIGSNVVDPMVRKSAEALGEEVAELVKTWFRNTRAAKSFLDWIAENS